MKGAMGVFQVKNVWEAHEKTTAASRYLSLGEKRRRGALSVEKRTEDR